MQKRQAARRKYHYIYKTTCQVNGKYYYGMHSTDDLEDGYIGSGLHLRRSIKKYGREKFSIEILEFCDSREALKLRESELITEEMLQDSMCMNLKLGGEGGFHLSKDQYKARNAKCGKRHAEKHVDMLRQRFIEYNKATSPARNKLLNPARNLRVHLGSKRTKESKDKISIAVSGPKNGSYGTIWVFNDELRLSKKINSESIKSYLDDGWKQGRKINFDRVQLIKQPWISGEENGMFGTCWIFNNELKMSKCINKGDLSSHLTDGWCKGRKMSFNV